MRHNATGNQRRNQRDRAALLVAEDRLSDEVIAADLGIHRATLDRWKHDPPFDAAVQAHKDRWARELADEGIANQRNRLAAYNDRWERLQQVIDERAAYFSAGDETEVPGGTSGLIVRTEKQIGGGERAQHIVEYAIDTGLLGELRALEKQAAQDMGQWTQHVDIRHRLEDIARQITAETGEPLEVVLPRITDLAAERRKRSA